MKTRVLWILGAMALLFSLSLLSCSKEEIKEATEMDFANVSKTWAGKYGSLKDLLVEGALTTDGEITVSGDKNSLTIDTKDVKGLKLTVTKNTLVLVNASVQKNEELGVEGGTFTFTTLSDNFPVTLTVDMKEASKSFFFKANKKTK